MISAGRVLLMPKGDYDSTATYEMLDIVSYNGSSYIAKSTTTGNLPTNTTYWQLSAYGGQAANLAGNFAPLETTDYASRAYAIDDIFVDKSSQLVIATTTINIGDEIEIGSNCDATTMAELLDAIENRYDALDQRNRKLVGINPITIQTDLHLLAPGEYFKKLTTFYVTNAPTGINQVPTAIFRLTVESGLDESGSSLLLTLRTIEGEIYTQAYDGSVWSDWKKTGDIADVPTYTGATSITSGVKGLVPAAAAAEKDNYLKGDGTWGALGTAAAKDSTNAVTSGSTDLVESGAVYSELALKADSEKAYQTDDTTETTLASDDIIPFYDASATAKRKMTVQKFGEQLISNPNLLDNPWFTVNQRGFTSTTDLTAYTVDRWKIAYNPNGKTLSLADGVFTLDNSSSSSTLIVAQIFENNDLAGHDVTASVKLSNDTIVSNSTKLPSPGGSRVNIITSDDFNIYAAFDNNSRLGLYIEAKANKSVAIKAMKLELGSVSTLAMDTAPNYATELLKCQRYFQRIKQNSGASKPFLFACITNDYIDGDLSLPVPMRNIPTVTLNNCTTQIPSKTNISLSSVAGLSMANNLLYLYIPATGVTVGEVGYLRIGPDGYIDLSADL